MFGWWESLGTGLQVFYAIAIATSAVLAVQLALMVLGLDHHTDAHDGDAGGGILSVRTITAFFTGFGWTGVVALQAGWTLLPTLVVATAVGGGFMTGVLGLMRGLYALRHSGTLDYKNAIGNAGSVYLTVPAAMRAPGQVEVMIQGRLQVVQAFTRSEHDLPNRSRIRVVGVLDQGTLIVEPLQPPTAPANLED